MVSVTGAFNATANIGIPNNSVPLTLWQQFGECPFPFQHDNAPMHKVRSMRK